MYSKGISHLNFRFIFILIFFTVSVNAQTWNNQIKQLYPRNNQLNVELSDSIVIEFEKTLEVVSGSIHLYSDYNILVESIDLNGAKVKNLEDTLLIIHPSRFNPHWSYNIRIDTGAFGSGYPGIHDPNLWKFSTTNYLRELYSSENVGDEFMVFIALPKNYDPGREEPYPLVLRTDGNDASFYDYALDLQEQGDIPECIVAGVGYKYGDNLKRERDMIFCPGGEKFYSFIKSELLPYLLNNYNIDNAELCYYGYSLGGSFGLHMLNKFPSVEDRLFKSYILADPTILDEDCEGTSLTQQEEVLNNLTDSLGINLFLTTASGPGNRPGVEPFMETLHSRDYKNFALYTWIIPNTNHNNVGTPSYTEGLIWALNDPDPSNKKHIVPGPDDKIPDEEAYIPINEANPDTLFSSEEECLAMVEDCYNIQKYALYGFTYQLLYHSLDDRFISEYPSYDKYKLKDDDEHSNNIYNRLFAAFNFCNKALEGLANAPLNEEKRGRLKGEVLFNRALSGFYALHMFKNFPYPENVVDYQDNYELFALLPDRFPNDRRESLKKQITEDLNAAIDLLPMLYSEGNEYRATRGAALALLGKHQLYNQEWEAAASSFREITEMGIYELSSPRGADSADYVNAYLCNFAPRDLHTQSSSYKSEFNKESVVEINFYEIPGGSEHEWLPGWRTQGSLYSSYFGPHVWHNIAPTREFVEQFESLDDHPAGLKFDPRKYATIFEPGDPLDPNPGAPLSLSIFDPEEHALDHYNEGYGLKKYFVPLHYHPYSIWFANEDTNNWRVIRYSDVLLMYAEALYHLGGGENHSTGLALLNTVRKRAGLENHTSLSPEAIMHERDVEFGGEALRFMDLIRWSKLENPWFDVNTLDNFTQYEDEYLPVIQPEIDNLGSFLSNGAKDSLTTFNIPQLPDYSSISYSLAAGEGDDDNSKFYIEGNVLFAQDTLYYHEQRDYSILVMAEDKFGGSTSQKFRFRVMEPSSTPEIEKDLTRIWPNPVSDGILNIESETAGRIFIYNVHGKLIATKDIRGHESLDVKNIDRGIYILRLEGMRGSEVFRVVVQ